MTRLRAAILVLSGVMAGCGEESGTTPGDTTPPGRVEDLTAESRRGGGEITLRWTAPGDDGMSGEASQYSFRYAALPLTEAAWDSAVILAAVPVPRAAGNQESLSVSTIEDGTWYFGLKTADEVPNWSALSNVVSGTLAPDTLAPSGVTDLDAVSATENSVTLSWTAPGDDGNEGTAAAYDLRYALAVITEKTWDDATAVPGEPSPGPAGTKESLTVGNLATETEYYFALETLDEVPNRSILSNVASLATIPDTIPPSAITDLAVIFATTATVTLRWTAPGDDGDEGTASAYDLRYATDAITEETFGDAVPVDVPAPGAPGIVASAFVTGLDTDTTYFFALRTADEAPNWSALSNVVDVPLVSLVRFTTSPAGRAARGPAWSHDGQQIAFHASWNDPIHEQIYVKSIRGGGADRLTDDADFANHASWSPDDTQIAYMTHRYDGGPFGEDDDTGLWVQAAEPFAPRVLLAQHGNGQVINGSSWSPDGARIVYSFSVTFPSPFLNINIVPSTGGPTEQFLGGATGNVGPAWSPDGTQIAFGSNRGGGNYDIWVAPVNGGALVQLTSDPATDTSPAWSPDGSRIAFTSARAGNADIWVMSSSGEDPTQLTFDPALDDRPSWSPGGDAIAFESWRVGISEIWIMASTGEPAPGR